MAKGYFISIEGGEGSGKSTQIKLLHQSLLAAGISVLLTREPGGTPSAEAIRALLVNGEVDKWHPISETLLFYAARAEHVERCIKPALAAGDVVLSDRFADSTFVYQGIAKGLGLDYLKQLHRLALGDFMPDITLFLDIEPSEGLRRASSRNEGENRFELAGIAFHEQVRDGFRQLAAQDAGRVCVVDASGAPQSVHAQIIRRINELRGTSLQPVDIAA